jgi:hypothetical protein
LLVEEVFTVDGFLMTSYVITPLILSAAAAAWCCIPPKKANDTPVT